MLVQVFESRTTPPRIREDRTTDARVRYESHGDSVTI
jgi:hypothetical protein